MIDRELRDRVLISSRLLENGCWEWQRGRNSNGYGAIVIGSRLDGSRRTRPAHVVSFEAFVGPVPDGLQIDHLCMFKACVNPCHLEAVTGKVNIQRANLALHPTCPQGHPHDKVNVRGHRICSICMTEAKRRARRKAQCA